MSAARLQRVVLEVERKFSGLRSHPLKFDGGSPNFHTLQYLGTRTFRDLYFDQQSRLSQAGTWVRQRDGRWESKIRQAGDYNNSQFREITDPDEIAQHVHTLTKVMRPSSEAFGLLQMADITTSREMWKADNRFKIVVDRTDFGHVVGEVELESSVTVESDSEAKRLSSLMDSEVANFMKRYQWAFDTRPAIGKLTAYFGQPNQSHKRC